MKIFNIIIKQQLFVKIFPCCFWSKQPNDQRCLLRYIRCYKWYYWFSIYAVC